MKFYRHLSAIKAISFDLDDTLYSNFPVMIAAEAKMIDYFAQHFKSQITTNKEALYLDQKFWYPFRAQAIEKKAVLAENVVALRLKSYYLGALSLGYSEQNSQEKALQAMSYFAQVRSEFTVPKASHQLLGKLAKHYPLVAISNGNVDTKAIGIDHYFSHIYHALDGLKQKPDSQMFHIACNELAIEPQELLHVGDCGRADIQGAISAGCQTAWLPLYNIGKPLTVLPHVELADVAELAEMLL